MITRERISERESPSCNRTLTQVRSHKIDASSADCAGFRHDVVPVVMGARREDYTAIAPPESFIHVDDFTGPRELAAYLRRLDADAALYNEYFRWKDDYELMDDTRFLCRLCMMLHLAGDEGVLSWYDDYHRWSKEACRD